MIYFLYYYLFNNKKAENKPYKDEITIIYKINKSTTKFFGENFVKKNKKFCKVIINGIKYNLKEYYKTDIKVEKLKIILIGISKVTDMSYLFYKCYSLLSLPDISEWDTSNIINMSNIFAGCLLLSFLSDISKWKTSKVTNMSHMFYACMSLTSLPDISIWDTSNVKNMKNMFAICKSLLTLPDISKWNISKVEDIGWMFQCCECLKYLPDISK